MSHLYRAEGIVLRTIKLGESDRIVTICTKERGKVRAVAKGVRKTKSKFGGRLEPTSHVALQCYEGRELDIVTQAESLDVFRLLREDLSRLGRAMAMLEAVENISQEGHENPALFAMLHGALRELDRRNSPMIVGAFFWKLLAHDGMHPLLDRCSSCGSAHDLRFFDLQHGGVACATCRRGTSLSPHVLDLVRSTLSGGLAGVLAESESAEAFAYEHLADEAMEHHLERRIRSRHVFA